MRIKKFSVSNFRSFNSEQAIVFNDNFNISAFFGPNGSGKTNLFRAMLFFRDFIRMSTKYTGDKMFVETFALNNASSHAPTKFLAEFSNLSYNYEYSFSIRGDQIADEYLRKSQDGEKYTTIFRRKSITTGRYSNYGFTPELVSKTRDKALILTKAWEDNNQEALDFFQLLEHFRIIAGVQPTEETSRLIMEQPGFKNKVLTFLKNADLYIQDISVSQVNVPDELIKSLPLTMEFKRNLNKKGYSVLTTHFIYDHEKGGVVGAKPLSLGTQESNGTQRMYELAYPVIDSLENGNILCIDEFELFLHPHECEYIINLFKDEHVNPHGAQLIVMTHATQIMNYLGPKNVYLVGKNSQEETIIRNMTASGGVRQNDKAIEKKYLRGFFGGVPNIERAL